MKFLEKIRIPEKSNSVKRQILATTAILLFGIFMGLFSKFLDYRHAELPSFLRAFDEFLDFHNFLGGFAPWIITAVCISVYSRTPVRAGINVFFFFGGFVSSYYIYSNFVAGFFPRSYALIWIGFAIISPFLSFLTWYSKGTGPFAIILSAGILSILINTSFSYGMFYIDISSWLNLAILLIGIIVLRRTAKEMLYMAGIAVILAMIINALLPFSL